MMEDGFEPLLKSILPSAASGQLKHLDISTNCASEGNVVDVLCQVLKDASSLEVLFMNNL